MAQRYGLIACWCPLYTGNVYCHHIIIIMEIDADMMAKLPNNQTHFGCAWNAKVQMVGEVARLNGME
jgi:hypothetical protein